MCVLGKENYWIKTTMHKKSHKYHEKLKQKIIKCLICFPNRKIILPSLHFLHQGIAKPKP